MKKLTKREKIILGASIAVGAGLAVFGIKQKIRMDVLAKNVLDNSNKIDDIENYIQNSLDPLMPDVIEVIDQVIHGRSNKN